MTAQEYHKSELDLYVINKVKNLRLSFATSQLTLANKLGVSQAFIATVENPKHRAKYNLEHLNKLAEIFNCSPKDFLPDKPINQKRADTERL